MIETQPVPQTEAAASPAAAARPRPWSIFSSTSFRKLWLATILSGFGDFFSYVAMAWLVLQLTGSGVALGTVLLVKALPRAVLMIVGGASADRLSPRLTMLGSMGVRAAFVTPLAILVIMQRVQMWEVYGTAVVLGPVIGGLIVTALGVGWAFAADAACFALGFLFVLWLPAARRTAGQKHPDGGLGGQIVAGLRYAWADTGIRVTLIVIAVIDFAANASIGVGLPTLAHARLGAGAAGFGILLGAWGVGATMGALGAGFVPPPKRFGWLIVGLCAWLGVGIGAIGLLPSLVPAALL